MSRTRTKIVCTIGPSSASEDILRKMVKAGMNVARLNFSHGTHEEHAELIRTIRKVAAELDEPVAILQDLQGPKIRVGVLPEKGVVLKKGATVTFTTSEGDIKKMRLPVTYANLHKDVKAGERLLLDDGLLSARITKVDGRDVVCEVVDGGTLFSHKGINFPESAISASAVTEKDEIDAKFGVAQGVDWMALSFVRSASDVKRLRAYLDGLAGPADRVAPIRLIAKIEKHEALEHFDEILEAVDGIMVARGDLGIETPAEEVPLVQKRLIEACLKKAKPVIVATQMLESMISHPRPTRAEVSDVANAVIDHADAVMLSNETAGGQYPLEAVETMARVVAATEASRFDDLPPPPPEEGAVVSADEEVVEEAVTEAAALLSHGAKAALMLVVSPFPDTARLVSRFRPELPILALVREERVRRQLNLSWGVIPFVLPRTDTGTPLEHSLTYLRHGGYVHPGDRVVVVAGDKDDPLQRVSMAGVREIT